MKADILPSEWAPCQANLNGLNGAWLAADQTGEIRCANSQARVWLNGNVPLVERNRVRRFVDLLSSGRIDFGLLPLASTSLTGQAFACPWQDHAILVNLNGISFWGDNAVELSPMLKKFSESLRDPVSKLELFTHLLSCGPSERRGFYEQTLRQETARMARLIENISLLGKLMSSPRIMPTPVTLSQLGRDIEDTLVSLHEEGVDQSCVSMSGNANTADMNTRMICTAIRNLILFAPRPDPSRERSAVHIDLEKSWMGIKLIAPGFFIHQDELSTLFEPFGSGTIDLELIVVRSILDYHQGHLTVNFRDDRAYFTLWLPCSHTVEAVSKNPPTGEEELSQRPPQITPKE